MSVCCYHTIDNSSTSRHVNLHEWWDSFFRENCHVYLCGGHHFNFSSSITLNWNFEFDIGTTLDIVIIYPDHLCDEHTTRARIHYQWTAAIFLEDGST